MATSDSNWLTLFPTMSTGMKVQMISNLPSSLDRTKLFAAIFDLPFTERSKLLKNIPRETLKSLILSLPRETQESYLKMMTSVVSNQTTTSNNNRNNKPSSRDTKLKAAFNKLNHSTTKNENIQINNKSLTKYCSHGKLRKQLAKLSKIEYQLDKVDAISDYDDDNDRLVDKCSKHINYNQFKKEYFLMKIIRMMRSFGDGPRPSRYSALIILNHIKSYLKSVINKMESEGNSKNYFDILEEWYPMQVKVFKKWKYFKFQSKKHEQKAPDLLNDDDSGNDNDDDDKNDNFIDSLNKNKNKNDLRLIESDKFTMNMDKRQYFKFAKCREASLTSNKKRFYKWLGFKQFNKMLTYFYGFLAWDRIGFIVQKGREINNVKYGIIMCNNDFLTPTQIVQSILKINESKHITPFKFKDYSFDRIDLTYVGNINTNSNVNKKRIIGNDVDNPPNKKRRLN